MVLNFGKEFGESQYSGNYNFSQIGVLLNVTSSLALQSYINEQQQDCCNYHCTAETLDLRLRNALYAQSQKSLKC